MDESPIEKLSCEIFRMEKDEPFFDVLDHSKQISIDIMKDEEYLYSEVEILRGGSAERRKQEQKRKEERKRKQEKRAGQKSTTIF